MPYGIHTGYDEEDPLFQAQIKLGELRVELSGIHRKIDGITKLLRGVRAYEKEEDRKSIEESK